MCGCENEVKQGNSEVYQSYSSDISTDHFLGLLAPSNIPSFTTSLGPSDRLGSYKLLHLFIDSSLSGSMQPENVSLIKQAIT